MSDTEDKKPKKVELTPEAIRKRNALYSRRLYHRRKDQLDGLQKQVREIRKEREKLQKENVRLEGLVARALRELSANSLHTGMGVAAAGRATGGFGIPLTATHPPLFNPRIPLMHPIGFNPAHLSMLGLPRPRPRPPQLPIPPIVPAAVPPPAIGAALGAFPPPPVDGTLPPRRSSMSGPSQQNLPSNASHYLLPNSAHGSIYDETTPEEDISQPPGLTQGYRER